MTSDKNAKFTRFAALIALDLGFSSERVKVQVLSSAFFLSSILPSLSTATTQETVLTTLLNQQGIKVDGVSYTQEDAQQGRIVVF